MLIARDRDITNTDMRLLNKAIEKAMSSHHHKYWFGAIVAKNGIPIGIGININTTHPDANNEYNRLHAEVYALLKARKNELNFRNTTIYIARVTKTRKMLGNAKPCPNCLEYIVRHGVKRIVYTRCDNSAEVIYG